MEAQSGRSNENVVINVGSLCSLKVELSDACLSMPLSYCIFKTPTILFRHKETSFLPNCFSIGPMHHGKQNLLATEKIKVKYLKALLVRVIGSRYETMSEQSKENEEQNVLSDWIDSVEMIKEKASSCYAGRDFAAELGDEFVKTMLLDGVFVIELFRKDAEVVKPEPDDPIFSMSCMLQYLHHDLILLENQIPWLVLDLLYEKTRLRCETKSLIELALMFFANTFTSHPPPINTSRFKDEDIKHILDLLRSSLVLPFQEPEKKNESSWQPIRSITMLKEAGVKFMKAVPEPDSVLDIRFRDGCLTIPSLLIQETTETIFRNLIAYEQCLPKCQPIFTCYAKLLDNLIDTTNDMEILCKREIFDNWLSPDDATQFFNNLYNDTFVKEFYYSELCNKLDCHCKRMWPRWRAYYVQNYFSKPWAIAAQIYAVVMLVLTVWQTYIRIELCCLLYLIFLIYRTT
ncbi:hypothetical protein E1A91_A09G040200v1 [Gossypium mustelinum]|uniref:Uncharacterized protein n=1 Tax=Gossypium mustelinum TaxID=34275 RepID=A0A5D2XTP6_GOSMU|nr:hypothetical protein E1A91_A09G040200v1 [Gossypium mustelinum]